MVRKLLASVLLLSGCDVVFGLDRDRTVATDAQMIDGATELCFGGRYGGGGVLEVCLDAPPPERFAPGPTIRTGAATTSDCTQIVLQADPRSTAVCVIAATRIDIAAGVRVTGGRPLVLVATDELRISGDLDASSRTGSPGGAGASHPSCTRAHGANSGGAGGGGGGGTYGSAGGDGGDAQTTNNGGIAEDANAFSFVRGGCGGGDGGNGLTSLVVGGPGGESGGAIYLIAGGIVAISGTINVSGAAGRGGAANGAGYGAGGGGGGSGGLIGIDAPVIALSSGAQLIANGAGAGGGGGSMTAGGTGGESDLIGGTFPYPTSGGTPGSAGGSTAGGGGRLGALPGEPGADATGGAGGGGGGVGTIRLFTPDRRDAGALYSPAPNPVM